MVFFFIAELALTMACRLGVWCLGKTCKGIVYVVTQSHALDDDDAALQTQDSSDDSSDDEDEASALSLSSSK